MAVEVWLRNNARALWLGTLLPVAIMIAGGLLAWGLPVAEDSIWNFAMSAVRPLGVLMLVGGALLIAALAIQLRRPRLAYRDGKLLVWLRGNAPIQVPIEHVEGFLLGQAPSLLPGKRHKHVDAASLVIRIADSATEWRHRDVKPQFGSWCEGYVTIRGTWCEPLDLPLVNRLNERLAEVTQGATRERTRGR
jgi:hypothetical protein